jgi:hypothetical protein
MWLTHVLTRSVQCGGGRGWQGAGLAERRALGRPGAHQDGAHPSHARRGQPRDAVRVLRHPPGAFQPFKFRTRLSNTRNIQLIA